MASSTEYIDVKYTLLPKDLTGESDLAQRGQHPQGVNTTPETAKPIPAIRKNVTGLGCPSRVDDLTHGSEAALVQEHSKLGDRGDGGEFTAGDKLARAKGFNQAEDGCQWKPTQEKRANNVELQPLYSVNLDASLTEHGDIQANQRSRTPPLKKLQRLQSQLNLGDLSRNEIELKASLYFHIGNPIKRWRVDRVVPVKLLLQLLKTFCLIVQVILFTDTIAHQRSEFFYNSRVVFESLFIKSFHNGIIEPRDYYTLFSIQQMMDQIDHISKQYFALPNVTIGGYDFVSIDENGDPTPLTMELTQYKVVELNTINNSYTLNGDLSKTLITIRKQDNASRVYRQNSNDPFFHRFVSLVVKIPINNIRVVHPERAECFLFNVSITYENQENIGKIRYLLEEKHTPLQCNEEVQTGTKKIQITYGLLTVLDVMVITMCVLSIILTVNSIKRGRKLGIAMRAFYRKELGIKISWWEIRSMFPLWHLLNTVSDLLIITGSLYKIFLEYRVSGLDDANPANLMLGIAVLFQAVVFLRYVGYFKQLNALNRTIALAFPELLKFLVCAGVLFLAFVLNGYIILRSYHTKFATFHASLDTLFGLINGDDIYGTFAGIDEEDDIFAFVYCRIYMYIFLALFLYFVLNLFTSLVITAHESSQTYDTAYDNEVRRFVFSGPLTTRGAALRDITVTKNYVDPEVIRKRLKRPPPADSSGPARGRVETDPDF